MANVDFEAGARAGNDSRQPRSGGQYPFPWSGEKFQAVSYPLVPQSNILENNMGLSVAHLPRELPVPSKMIEADVKKIAILRSNGIGDFLFALPAIEALRVTYPQAEIVLLGLDWHEKFLAGRPSPIDRVIAVPRSRGISHQDEIDEDPHELGEFFQRMVEEKFDLGIQIHGGGRFSNPFMKRLGARVTIGLRAQDAIPLDRWVPYNYYQLEILRYLEVVSLVGARPTTLEPCISVTRADLEEAQRFAPHSQKPVAVIHPGAGDSRRHWPTDKFAAAGNALAWSGAQVVVIGTEMEQELVDAVINTMAVDALNLCGKLSLGGLAGLLSRASVMVSNDSGPLHLAAAVGAPTVGIYWCGNLVTAGPVTRARHRTAISWQLDCPVCGLDCTRNDCGHDASFVANVPVADVITSALELARLAQPDVQALLSRTLADRS